MAALVIAEHDNTALASATLSVIAAAGRLDREVDVLVVGQGCAAVAQQAAACAGVREVLVADYASCAHQLAEVVAPIVAAQSDRYTSLLAAATTTGKDLMPRVAALLDVAQVSDIIAVVSADTFQRPIYAGNIVATVRSNDPIKVITVRVSAFDGVAAEGGSATIGEVPAAEDPALSRFVKDDLTQSDRPELTEADIVVSGGRGIGDAEKFVLIEQLADKLGAAVGASRAAVDAGFVPNDFQVGQTGKIVAPKLYVAIGISGAIQHLAGMKNSKVVVAINKDAEAPIFEIADYGLVADLFTAVPELIATLDS